MRAGLALAALCLPCLVLAAPPPAAPPSWSINAAHSQVRFSVRKLWFAHERGTFPGLHGSLREIDTRIHADMGVVDATLEVANLRMDDAKDRARALGPDFFDVKRFPTIGFDSDPFPLGELVTGGTLRGRLALHGERHPVTLTLLPSDCPLKPLECTIRAQGSISRTSFGMRGWRGVLSNKVKLDLQIVVRTHTDAAAPARHAGPEHPGR